MKVMKNSQDSLDTESTVDIPIFGSKVPSGNQAPYDATMRNKIVASLLLVIAMIATILLSWVASPDPFITVFYRSVPAILMFLIIIFVTVSGASTLSRVIASVFLFVASIIYLFLYMTPEWGVPYLIIGLTFVADILISVAGCKSPMKTNANENFLAIALLFFAGFVIGIFFELLNDSVMHLWVMNTITFYPMVSMFGINLLVLFTWSFIGILLYEFSLLIGIGIKIIGGKKELACTI